MTWSQTFVVLWIQFAVTAAVVLFTARAVLHWIRQPIDRIRLIQCMLIAALATPIAMKLAPWPLLKLAVVALPNAETPTRVVTETISPADMQPPRTIPHPREMNRPAIEPGLVPEKVDNQPSANAGQPTATNSVIRWGVNYWVIAAILIGLTHVAALVFQLCEWHVGAARLRAIVRSSSSATPQLLNLWNEVARGRGNMVRLFVSPLVDTPLTFSWLRPVVVIPEQLAKSDTAAIRYCLAHEWSHIQRADILTWQALWACQFLLWYQPLFWSLRRELRICQDILADGASAASCDDAIRYSELLVHFAKNRPAQRRLAGALTFFDHPSQLMRRVSMLLEHPISLRRHCTWPISLALAFSALSVTALLSGIRLEAVRADDQNQKEESKEQQKSVAEAIVAKPDASKSTEQKEKPIEGGKTPGVGTDAAVALTYSCIVVDYETGKGIPNARVTVERQDSSTPKHTVVAKTHHVTDAAGKYTVEIPPEQAGLPTMYIRLIVEHDDYVRVPGSGYSLNMIRKNETFGERPFFESVRLHPADRVSGKVVSPSGKPMAGVKIFGFTAAKPRDWNNFGWLETKTADDGTFRVNLIKQGPAFIWIYPDDYAIAERYVDKDRGDLGDIQLTEGNRITGQVLSAEGKPVAGVALNAYYQGKENAPLQSFSVLSGIRRGTITDSEGRFTFDPLPVGDYRVVPEGESSDPRQQRSEQSHIPLPGVFVGKNVTLANGVASPQLEIQGVPHIVFAAQYLTSDGKKTRGSEFWISGQMDGQFWSTRAHPDKQGTAKVLLPHGLQGVHVGLITNEHSSLRYRRGPGQPIESGYRNINLGTLNDDVEGFEIIRYKAPIALIKAVDTQGRPVRHFNVSAFYSNATQKYNTSVSCERQDAEHYRTSQMLPDEEVTFQGTAIGYLEGSAKFKFSEGESKEVVITLKGSPAVDAINSAVDGTKKLLDKIKPDRSKELKLEKEAPKEE